MNLLILQKAYYRRKFLSGNFGDIGHFRRYGDKNTFVVQKGWRSK
jgi:hypothetical protein